jgi:NAD(P)-dependent dehydrogenase (short-subunit alcohol dehydrogenase family)
VGILDDRVTVVTGGATGIGLASARRFAAEGATVVMAGRDATRGEGAAEAIRGSGGRATFVRTDVTDDGQVAALAQQAAGERGVIDVWFNNAGVEGRIGGLGDVDDLSVRQLLDTNIKGLYSGMRYAVERMRTGGVIINTSSFIGTATPVPLAIAYGGTKAAVASMTRAAALALADQGIDVVAIAPWVVDTPMMDRLSGGQGLEARAGFAAKFAPSGKLTPPDEVADVVVGLAGRTVSYHSGDVLLIDAGPSVTPIGPDPL